MENICADQQIKIESNKSTGSQDSGPSSCTTMQISSVNNSSAKTLTEYDIDDFLDIKEETIKDEEVHQRGKQNLLSRKTQLNEKFITSAISSDNRSGATTLIEYDYDETLEIKEEIIQEQENTDQRLNKKYESKLGTLNTREADIMTVKKPRIYKKKKIQESKSEPKYKYNCEKCARSYVQKTSLLNHIKYICHVTPQFNCEFCGKRFKLKGNMNVHILRVHRKTKSKVSQARHNCVKCSRSYSSLISLNTHNSREHAAAIPQFICDFCGFQTKRKETLSRHITSRHFQKFDGLIREAQKEYKCEKCARSYVQKGSLSKHKKLECDVILQFSCKFCGKRFTQKCSMNRHIFHVHQKINSKVSQTRHNCDKCSRSYIWPGDLRQHKRLEHAAVIPQFTCDFCGFQKKRKNDLLQHINSQHLNM